MGTNYPDTSIYVISFRNLCDVTKQRGNVKSTLQKSLPPSQFLMLILGQENWDCLMSSTHKLYYE